MNELVKEIVDEANTMREALRLMADKLTALTDSMDQPDYKVNPFYVGFVKSQADAAYEAVTQLRISAEVYLKDN